MTNISTAVTPKKLGDIIDKLMDKVPQKVIAFDNNIGFRDVSELRRAWPLFCGLVKYKAED